MWCVAQHLVEDLQLQVEMVSSFAFSVATRHLPQQHISPLSPPVLQSAVERERRLRQLQQKEVLRQERELAEEKEKARVMGTNQPNTISCLCMSYAMCYV